MELSTILDRISADVVRFEGDATAEIAGPAPIASAAPNEITFCNRPGPEAQAPIARSTARTFVVDAQFMPSSAQRVGLNFIFAHNPRLTFMRIVARCFAPARPQGVHPSAVIDPVAEIHPTAYVGPLCYVGKARIGAQSILWGSVRVYDRVRIGDRVSIHAGTVLGADGFGYERAEDGTLEKFPHVGGIVIEDDVEIGANACVDRGTLGDTILRRGSKIDNLVHVAHNVDIGESAAVIAHAMLGGSATIGAGAWIAPSACIRDQIAIGAGSTVGLAAVVTKPVAEGDIVLGSPARSQPEYTRVQRALKQLAAGADERAG